MSILKELQDICHWNKIGDQLFTFHLGEVEHYEIAIISYNYHEPYLTNALGYLVYVNKVKHGSDTLFFRTVISGEKPIGELLKDAVADYIKYSESEK